MIPLTLGWDCKWVVVSIIRYPPAPRSFQVTRQESVKWFSHHATMEYRGQPNLASSYRAPLLLSKDTAVFILAPASTRDRRDVCK